jgi:amidase
LKVWFEKALQADGGLSKVLTGVKVGILKEGMENEAVHPEMRKKVYESAYKLRQLGAEVTEVSMPAHKTGRDIWMGVRRLGGAITLSGKASGRKQYSLTPFLDKVLPLTQEKWDRTPPAVKSTIINGNYALEKYPTLYHKCLNLAIQRKSQVRTTLLNTNAF